jgi:hypothetical protein
MAGVSGTLTSIVLSMLTSTSDGANVRIGALVENDSTLQAIGVRSIVAMNASVDISEKTGYVQYPLMLVYCDKASNTLKEKFRQFSGTAHMVVEARYSQDKLNDLQANTEVYADAVCALLDDSRGDWGSGFFYAGGYEVSYAQVVRGGNNFLQVAKVGFDVDVSK